jgi:hypothetical protein
MLRRVAFPERIFWDPFLVQSVLLLNKLNFYTTSLLPLLRLLCMPFGPHPCDNPNHGKTVVPVYLLDMVELTIDTLIE